MRFLSDGADVPDELIRVVNEGSAVFVCGAGVSMRVGLPSFHQLTEQVYKKVGERYDNEPAERIAFQREEYDRALRSLEKRTHLPGTNSFVRAAVEELLAVPDPVSAPDHLALLQLSRNQRGQPRLLTTNFDTLFERAAAKVALPDALSYAVRSIPKPGIPADVVLTLVRAGTLSSADFIGTQTYQLADGSKMPSTTFRIRSLKVGNQVIENVTGSVAPVQGSLLLGQSFLTRFKSWSMDNSTHTLLLIE